MENKVEKKVKFGEAKNRLQEINEDLKEMVHELFDRDSYLQVQIGFTTEGGHIKTVVGWNGSSKSNEAQEAEGLPCWIDMPQKSFVSLETQMKFCQLLMKATEMANNFEYNGYKVIYF